MDKINHQISTADTGRLFAVVHVAGNQRKITTEDIVVLRKHLEADIGERIRLNKVRYRYIQSMLPLTRCMYHEKNNR